MLHMPTAYSEDKSKALTAIKSFTIVMAIVSVTAAFGQIQNHTIGPDDDGTYISQMLSVDTSLHIDEPDVVWKRLEQSSYKGDHFYGFIQEYLWAGITLTMPGEAKQWLLEIQNPHINFITLYTRVEGSDEWVLMAETGRATVFSTRAIPHFNVVFELAAG